MVLGKDKEKIMVEILFGESSAGSMKAAKCEDRTVHQAGQDKGCGGFGE